MKYFHGGPIGRQRGAFLLPPAVTRSASCSDYCDHEVHRKDRVYVTTDEAAALLYACASKNGVIYEVEPIGELEPDPDCSMSGLSFQCQKAKVLRIRKPAWHEIEMARKALLG